jgi:hypothetical protein
VFEESMLRATDHVLRQRQILEYRPASWRFCARDRRIDLLLDHGLALAGDIVRRAIGFPRAADVGEPSKLPYVRAGFNAWGARCKLPDERVFSGARGFTAACRAGPPELC